MVYRLGRKERVRLREKKSVGRKKTSGSNEKKRDRTFRSKDQVGLYDRQVGQRVL